MVDPNILRLESLAVVAYAIVFVGWSLSDPSPPDAAADARLVVTVSGAGSPRQTAVPTGGLIGRGAECDVRLDDGSVAKWQARLAFDGHAPTLEVLDLSALTSVNDRPVRGSVMLSAGDRIGVGSVTIVFDGVSYDRT